MYHIENEQKMFTDANLKLFGETKFIIDKLCIMQHHGLPTRLLDWTESILNALFFAVDDNKESSKVDGKLYILNAGELNKAVHNSDKTILFQPSQYQIALRANLVRADWFLAAIQLAIEEISDTEEANLKRWLFAKYPDVLELLKSNDQNRLKNVNLEEESNNEDKKRGSLIFEYPDVLGFNKYLSKPVGFKPIYKDKRMFSQQSAFTIHGGAYFFENPDDKRLSPPISIEQMNKEETLMGRIMLLEKSVPKDLKPKIKKALGYLGIHQGSIYQDLDNQSLQIKEYWQTANRSN